MSKLTNAQLWTMLLAIHNNGAVSYGGEDADNVSITVLRNLLGYGYLECSVYNGSQVYDLTAEGEEYLIEHGYIAAGVFTQHGKDTFIHLGGKYRHG